MAVPTFLQQNAMCIAKTANGFALAPEANSLAEQCLFFATLDELAAYLAANWAV